jgi:hypothetical protein
MTDEDLGKIEEIVRRVVREELGIADLAEDYKAPNMIDEVMNNVITDRFIEDEEGEVEEAF